MAQVTGKFISSLPIVEGVTNGRDWARGGLVIESVGENPKYIALTIFGRDRLKLLQGLNSNDLIVVEYSPESRNVGDRWYTDLRCISIRRTIKINQQ